jgi:hypothetical protein
MVFAIKILDNEIEQKFQKNFQKYAEAVAIIEQAEEAEPFYQLPQEYKSLSIYGKARVYKDSKELNVTFIIRSGSYNYVSVLFTSSDGKFLFDKKGCEIKEIKPHWYFLIQDMDD